MAGFALPGLAIEHVNLRSRKSENSLSNEINSPKQGGKIMIW